MVRAILDGSKTQTRRVVKPKLVPVLDAWREPPSTNGRTLSATPFGMPGDRLWVRETWAWPGEEELLFRAEPKHAALVDKWNADPYFPKVKWKPSIFMERKHSRITLEVTGVRAERLHDITESDALAEGVDLKAENWPDSPQSMPIRLKPWYAFSLLWQSINGPDSWDANPWVWVVEFRRLR
jgi:hypothetical protein